MLLICRTVYCTVFLLEQGGYLIFIIGQGTIKHFIWNNAYEAGRFITKYCQHSKLSVVEFSVYYLRESGKGADAYEMSDLFLPKV